MRPTPRRRWELRLSLAEREEISRGLAADLQQLQLAGPDEDAVDLQGRPRSWERVAQFLIAIQDRSFLGRLLHAKAIPLGDLISGGSPSRLAPAR